MIKTDRTNHVHPLGIDRFVGSFIFVIVISNIAYKMGWGKKMIETEISSRVIDMFRWLWCITVVADIVAVPPGDY